MLLFASLRASASAALQTICKNYFECRIIEDLYGWSQLPAWHNCAPGASFIETYWNQDRFICKYNTTKKSVPNFLCSSKTRFLGLDKLCFTSAHVYLYIFFFISVTSTLITGDTYFSAVNIAVRGGLHHSLCIRCLFFF